MDVLHRDAAVAELYIEDKLQRQSAWSCPRGYVAALENLGLHPITDCQLLANVAVRSIVAEERREFDEETGEAMLVDASGEKHRVIPADFDLDSFLVISNTADRGSIGASMASFASSSEGAGLTWVTQLGPAA